MTTMMIGIKKRKNKKQVEKKTKNIRKKKNLKKRPRKKKKRVIQNKNSKKEKSIQLFQRKLWITI